VTLGAFWAWLFLKWAQQGHRAASASSISAESRRRARLTEGRAERGQPARPGRAPARGADQALRLSRERTRPARVVDRERRPRAPTGRGRFPNERRRPRLGPRVPARRRSPLAPRLPLSWVRAMETTVKELPRLAGSRVRSRRRPAGRPRGASRRPARPSFGQDMKAAPASARARFHPEIVCPAPRAR